MQIKTMLRFYFIQLKWLSLRKETNERKDTDLGIQEGTVALEGTGRSKYD